MAKNVTAVAEGANWTQRIDSEQKAALDWYKEWGTIYSKQSAAPTDLDGILKQKQAELKKYAKNPPRSPNCSLTLSHTHPPTRTVY